MFGLGGDNGGIHPMDMIRNRVDSWRAHPFQQGLSSIAGLIGGPLGGFGAQAGFNRLNDSRFNNSAQAGYDRSLQNTTAATNSAMNAPLPGPLGNYDRSGDSNPFGGPQQGGGMATGGPQGGNPQTWQYGQFNNVNPTPPQQSPFVQSILDSIGPNGPGMSGNGGGPGGNGGGMGGMGSGGGFGSMLAGGGYNGVMNGASPGMMADFAAPMGGDWQAMVSRYGGQHGAAKNGAMMR